MAARLNPKQDERARSAIKTSQLINRLNCFALAEPGPQGEVVEIDSTRLRAIEILLKKTLPDLSAITLAGDPDNPIKTEEVGDGALRLKALLDNIADRAE